jgi:starvation-inducible DNA-binding protein
MVSESVDKKTKNAIGLDSEKSERLAGQLNDLLANYQVFYINARGFHWNITGERFFELHVKFEELYNEALTRIDEIAERIRTLDQTPFHTFSAYLERSAIRETEAVRDSREAVKTVVSGLQILLQKERALLKLAAEANDEGTVALMSDYIRAQEKSVWMYSAFLK